MKKPLKIVTTILVVLFLLSVSKDLIIKTSVEKGAELVTGLKLSMGSFKVGILRTLVGIKNLRLYNPKGYPEKIMLDMPEIYVDYDLGAITKGTIHLEEMRINLKEFVVVKNEKGELNLDALKVVQAEKEGKEPAPKAGGKAPEIQIDVLELTIGKVLYKDYSRGGAPSVKEFDLNLNERYENIDNPYSLVSLIVVKALMNTSIASLTNFDLGGLQGSVSETLAGAQQIAGEVAAKAQETLKAAAEATKKTQETIKGTTESIQKTTENLKETFKLPFGKQ